MRRCRLAGIGRSSLALLAAGQWEVSWGIGRDVSMGNYAKGKFAQNLIKWNLDSLTNLEYKKDFRRLGVILE